MKMALRSRVTLALRSQDMATAVPASLTLEEFLKQPETQPASEFIDGQVFQKPMPQGKHSRLQLKICEAVNSIAEPSRTALAFPELRCTFGGRSIVPDAAVFMWQRIPFDPNGEVPNSFDIAPDWTIEVPSPEQKVTKVISNILHCLRYGSQLGWLIDPEDRMFLAFQPGYEPLELLSSDRLPIPKFLPLDLIVDQIFGWLKVN